MEIIAKDMVDRAVKESGSSPTNVVVMENLGYVVVEGQPEFIRKLAGDPHVVSAIANEQAESMMIPPVRKRPEGTSSYARGKTRKSDKG